MEITLAQARLLHLAAQGFTTPPSKSNSKEEVLACIKTMSVLQIDTINVVERSPYLVLFSRLGNYDKNYLDELLQEKKIFEYWSHEACFLPIDDFPLYRPQMLNPAHLGWKFNQKWLTKNASQVQQVLDHVRQHGAMRSIDFQTEHKKSSGWWEWKPEKRSLEVLFTMGELMVERRQKFQRVYQLRERILPDWDDQLHLPSDAHCLEQFTMKASHALGICKAHWVNDYFRNKQLKHCLPELLKQAQIIEVKIKNSNETMLVHQAQRPLLEKILDKEISNKHCRLLSPFDPVVWDRKRALDFFDFDYKLECYTPEEKRQYGYFCLPILRNAELIGRLDAKLHRKEQRLDIKALHMENPEAYSQRLVQDLAAMLKECAIWLGAQEVHILTCNSTPLKNSLNAALAEFNC